MERISLSRLRKDPWPPSKARALRRPQHLESPARGGAGLYVLRHRRLADGFALTRPGGVDPHASFERCPAAPCIIRVVHIVVMGSGGVGGYFGAKLQRAGERGTMVARGPH